ncbi:hypothetical protein HPB47_002557 [Ixodes persulcatus]|uniref:Uncharacterized protein n=1 Tax=Ixodes persulcatus TaxID=34615 RepID=A0AC60PL24_IXOPE|nr:hypothetical protein HPB47_002557 [Ixodes persulcatus]
MAEKAGENPGNGEAALVSSSCLSSAGTGLVGMARIQQNPFAIKTTTPTRSVADSTENKESKPIVAPPTLVLGAEGACAVSSSGSKIVLRPSALAFQAEKLKQSSSALDSSTAGAETKDDISVADLPSNPRDLREVSSTCEATAAVTNGMVGAAEVARNEALAEESDTSNNGGTNRSSSRESHGLAPPVGELRNGTSSTELNAAGLLNSSDDAIHSPHPTVPPDGFVFGENLHERAANYDDVSSDSSVPSSTELTFQQMQAGQSVASSDQPTDLTSPGSSRQGAKSLSESAEEYQSRQVKRRYNEVTVVTGEENESNVLQINCKLFTFDKVTGSWQERGRGNLRLNDQEVDGVLQSRLVMRTQGSLRVILNTKVWSGMVVEHPSSKTVRTSAIDPDGIRVYLIQANGKDAEQLFSALDCRVATLKSAEENNPSSTPASGSSHGTQLSADSSSYADGTSLEDDSDGPCSKKARLLMHPEQGNLPDSSRSEDSASPGVPAECESSGEDNKG